MPPILYCTKHKHSFIITLVAKDALGIAPMPPLSASSGGDVSLAGMGRDVLPALDESNSNFGMGGWVSMSSQVSTGGIDCWVGVGGTDGWVGVVGPDCWVSVGGTDCWVGAGGTDGWVSADCKVSEEGWVSASGDTILLM